MSEAVSETVSPGDFLDQEVLPTLWDRLDQAFPEFGWKRKADRWEATAADFCRRELACRADRVWASRRARQGFLVQGGEAVSWTSYVSGKPRPVGRDFVEAVRDLARRAGVDPAPLDRPLSPEEQEARRQAELEQDILQTFLVWSQAQLRGPQGQAARDYLVRRGLPEDQLQDLGWVPGLELAAQELEAQGFTREDVERTGLLRDGRWDGRLVCPIWSSRGDQLQTFWARDLSGTAEAGAKYLFLAGHRKPVLYLAEASQAQTPLVLVEGVLDPLVFRAHGVSNLASVGQARVSVEQLQEVYRTGVRELVFALDADQAGAEGTAKALEDLAKAQKAGGLVDLEAWVLDPEDLWRAAGSPAKPDGYREKVDPLELLQLAGLEAWEAVLDQRIRGSRYSGRLLLHGVSPESPEWARRQAAERVAHLVETSRGPWAQVETQGLLADLCERTGWGPEELAPVFERADQQRREASTRARAEQLLEEVRKASEAGKPILDLLGTLRTGLASLEPRETLPPWFEVERVLGAVSRLPEGRLSGWVALDSQDLRFTPQELSLVAARTGHGKTSFMVNLLWNWLRQEDQGETFVILSCEEPEEAVALRLLVLASDRYREPGERGWTLPVAREYLQGKDRSLWPGHPAALDRARQELAQLTAGGRLLVVARPDLDAKELAGVCRSAQRELERKGRRVGAVLADYLQRIPAPAGNGSKELRHLEVSAVARELKALAVDLSCPVVAGAQINREAVKGAPPIPGDQDFCATVVQKALRARRPQLHQLREGGSEQEADLVLGLLSYRADFVETGEWAGEERKTPRVTSLEVGTLKARFGAPGLWTPLAFDGPAQLLRDPEAGEL